MPFYGWNSHFAVYMAFLSCFFDTYRRTHTKVVLKRDLFPHYSGTVWLLIITALQMWALRFCRLKVSPCIRLKHGDSQYFLHWISPTSPQAGNLTVFASKWDLSDHPVQLDFHFKVSDQSTTHWHGLLRGRTLILDTPRQALDLCSRERWEAIAETFWTLVPALFLGLAF